MRIIARYLLGEFLRILALVLFFFLLVYFIVDFIEKIGNFLAAGVAWSRIFHFFLMALPSVVFYMTPVAILVAILISLGLMARRGEIIAMKAGGISIYRLTVPVLLATALLGVLSFVLADTVIPETIAEVNAIWEREVQKKHDPRTQLRRDVWYRGPGDVYNFRVYDEVRQTAEGVSIFKFDRKFHLVQRIEANKAKRLGGRWELLRGLAKDYSSGGIITMRRFDREVFDLPELPPDVGLVERAAEELSSKELSEWIQTMENQGYDPLRYEVDLQFKYSFPFICVIMAVIGLPIAFWRERGGGIALGIGVGIGLSFTYLVFLGLARSLGYAGLLPPVMVAWTPNLIFTLLGLYLFTYVRQ